MNMKMMWLVKMKYSDIKLTETPPQHTPRQTWLYRWRLGDLCSEDLNYLECYWPLRRAGSQETGEESDSLGQDWPRVLLSSANIALSLHITLSQGKGRLQNFETQKYFRLFFIARTQHYDELWPRLAVAVVGMQVSTKDRSYKSEI